MKKVTVVPYDESWSLEFNRISEELLYVLDSLVVIEHVGSTSVEGLSAKPVIDIDIVIGDYNSFEEVKSRLASIGYTHEGDLGIKERHAFKYEDKPHLMRHHLYVCPSYSEEFKRHVAFRDYLRANPQDRDWYGELKTLAVQRFPEDIDGYMAAKSSCVAEIINRALL